jgi:ABC-2 type transport system ATP-binding protein
MCNAAATAVDASGITKRFGELSALRDVGLTAARGEIHGLLGPNGAGKTTLLRIVLGLVRRDEGEIRLFDRALPLRPARVPAGVGAALEGAGFYPFLSGRRNLELLARMDGSAVASHDMAATIARVGLAGSAGRRVGGYSAGMRQRLALAAALLRAPQLLLLDEPTNALDPAAARDVRSLIRELADGGTTVILSSHDLLEVESLCTSATILRSGEVVFAGTVDRLRALAGRTVYRLATSDDDAALFMRDTHADLHVERCAAGEGLDAAGDRDALDRYVVALGRAGIAVRGLQPRERSLETVFLQLTRAGVHA